MEGRTPNSLANAIEDLVHVVSQLRDPIKGCPWDLEQNHFSLIPYLLEEAYEVADAIREGTDKELEEELGDLLLQIVLHAQIAKEKNKFSLEEIAKNITKKLIRRHPHVFGDIEAATPDEVNKNWELIKYSEKSTMSSSSPISDLLRKKVRSLPAIQGAMEISKKTAKAGFEWDSIEGVWQKVNEELNELREALNKKNHTNAEEELGDLFFSLINIARWCDLNPEEGLKGTNKRFLERFTYVESSVKGNISDQTIDELQELWKAAKEMLPINNSN